MEFYTVEQIGEKRSATPEGFLLCQDVPIARTGVQIYGPGETQIPVGPDGLVRITRSEDEVFRPETIASFNGKPVLNDHPRDNSPVNPATWQHMAVGVVLNPRRGVGEQSNFLVADLMIQQANAIADVLAGKREVSCGYGAAWETLSPGHGIQKNIVGNHVAIVDRARCGAACSISDRSIEEHIVQQDERQGELSMFETIVKKIKDAWKAKDDTAFQAGLAEAGAQGMVAQFAKDGQVTLVKDDDEGGSGPHIHVHPNEQPRSKFDDEELENRFKAYDSKHMAHDAAIEELRQKVGAAPSASDAETKEIEGELKQEAPPGTGDAAFTDSALLEDSYKNTVALAEIIAPGVQLFAFDKARKAVDTFKDVCGLRRKALILGAKTPIVATFMQQIRGGRLVQDGEVQKMSCSQVRDMFYAVGAMKKEANNRDNRSSGDVSQAGRPAKKTGPTSIAEINAQNRKTFLGGN